MFLQFGIQYPSPPVHDSFTPPRTLFGVLTQKDLPLVIARARVCVVNRTDLIVFCCGRTNIKIYQDTSNRGWIKREREG